MPLPSSQVRTPQFSGSFYPDDGEELEEYLAGLLRDFAPDDDSLIHAQGCFVPHAGYIYSAECAARTFARIVVPDTVVLLHTKHVPQGFAMSVAPHMRWETPLGGVECARGLAERIVQLGPARFDANAEEGEHAAEVILPFLQTLNRRVRVCILSVARLKPDEMLALGNALARACGEFGEGDILLVASTDMHHYADSATTERLDDLALEQMEAMQPEGLLEVVERHDISMCGAAATATMMQACKKLGCSELVVVDHCDSSDTSGDTSHVVGYASGYLR